MGCWDDLHNPVIKKFMEEHNFTGLHHVQEFYTLRHVEMVKSLNLTPISWQDPLDFGVNVLRIYNLKYFIFCYNNMSN